MKEEPNALAIELKKLKAAVGALQYANAAVVAHVDDLREANAALKLKVDHLEEDKLML